MKARKFALTMRGITPLVMNSNTGMLDGSEDEKKETRDKAGWERDHFMDKTYRTPSGELYIPARAVKKSMIVACKFLPDKPKGTNFKSFGPFIEAATIVEEDALLDVSADKVIPWTVVVSLDPSKGPKGPRGPRTRPLSPVPWSAMTTIASLDDILTADILTKITEAAGLKCGLLDARAIDMGRCEMVVKELK